MIDIKINSSQISILKKYLQKKKMQVNWYWNNNSLPIPFLPSNSFKLEFAFQNKEEGPILIYVEDKIYEVMDLAKTLMMVDVMNFELKYGLIRGESWKIKDKYYNSSILKDVEVNLKYLGENEETIEFSNDSLETIRSSKKKKFKLQDENLLIDLSKNTCTDLYENKSFPLIKINSKPFWCYHNNKGIISLFEKKKIYIFIK